MGRESKGEALEPEIKKIRLAELEEFILSDYFNQLNHVPITAARAKSYKENPNSSPDDVVLIMVFTQGKLIAFRSLFAGVIWADNQIIRFGWCSGNWVHPDFRRKGLSELILKEAYAAWNGKLMFTNYAPESEKLYLKTGLFHAIHEYKGARAYLFLKKKFLKRRVQKKWIPEVMFSLTAFLIGMIAHLRILFLSSRKHGSLIFKEMAIPDKQCFQLLQENNKNFLFTRFEEDWNWIFGYPWIADTNRELRTKYPFSAVSESFFYRTVKVIHQNSLAGFFILLVHEGHLKTIFFLLPADLEKEVAFYIKAFAAKAKVEMITVYNEEIAASLSENKFPFLFVRKYGQKIYSSFEVQNAGEVRFRDGEGDYVFT